MTSATLAAIARRVVDPALLVVHDAHTPPAADLAVATTTAAVTAARARLQEVLRAREDISSTEEVEEALRVRLIVQQTRRP